VEHLLVFRDGSAKQRDVVADPATARVEGRRCGVAAGTPLAALLSSGVRPIRITDYGSCSRRPANSGGLYVTAIERDRAKGRNGWVYKVGNKVGTAGAADPAGPFGRGRLVEGRRVTWFWCRMRVRGCQRTLTIKTRTPGGGAVEVTVRDHDDFGRGRRVKGATVHAGDATATTNRDGKATLELEPGTVDVWATAKGRVRSFEEAVDVR
jgi:hypothetical protein